MEFEIPVADAEVDTSDLSGSLKSVGGAVAGFVALFGSVGIATYLYNRVKNLAGVEGQQNIPGV